MSFWKYNRFIALPSEIITMLIEEKDDAYTSVDEDLEDIFEIRDISGTFVSHDSFLRDTRNLSLVNNINNENYDAEYFLGHERRFLIIVNEQEVQKNNKSFPLIIDKLKEQIDKLSDALEFLERLRGCEITYKLEKIATENWNGFSLHVVINIEIIEKEKVHVKDTYLSLMKLNVESGVQSSLKTIYDECEKRGVKDASIDINHSEIDDISLSKVTVGWFSDEEIIPIATIEKSTGKVSYFKEFSQVINDYLEDKSVRQND